MFLPAASSLIEPTKCWQAVASFFHTSREWQRKQQQQYTSHICDGTWAIQSTSTTVICQGLEVYDAAANSYHIRIEICARKLLGSLAFSMKPFWHGFRCGRSTGHAPRRPRTASGGWIFCILRATSRQSPTLPTRRRPLDCSRNPVRSTPRAFG